MPSYNSTHTGMQIDNAVDTYQTQSQVQTLINSAIETAVAQTKLAMYPIGSIYMSLQNTNPSTFIGGTWQQIKDTFILAAGDTYISGDTGGNSEHTHTTPATTTGEHTLTASEIPQHWHDISLYANGINNARTHIFGYTNWGVGGGSNIGFQWGNYIIRADHGNPGDGAHSHTQVSTTTSSNSNMPPYLVAYIWKRVA